MNVGTNPSPPGPDKMRTTETTRSLAYLVSRYPTLSMTFILREVVQLRQIGFSIDVASINPPDRARKDLSEVEQHEADHTCYIKPQGIGKAAIAHFLALFGNFGGYWRGLVLAPQLGGLDLKRIFVNFGYFTEALMVGAWMRRTGHHHLHAHLGGPSATVGMYVKRVFGCGLSITVHGPDEFFDTRGQYLSQKVAVADFICCISSYGRSQLMRLSPYEHWNKLLVARLGVDPEMFSPHPRRPEPECFEILCVGRLTPAKGQHLLIDALDRLLQQGRGVRLRLVGAGADELSLRQRAAHIRNPDSIIFEGAVNPDRILELYQSADIFCLPSYAEGIPVALMEAMAMEIPCVSTTVAGIPELIDDGIDGLLVTPSELDELVAALSKLMDDRQLRDSIARIGRSRILKDYNLLVNVRKLAGIFIDRVQPEEARKRTEIPQHPHSISAGKY